MGKRSDFPRVERDYYQTPAEAVAPLLAQLQRTITFIEPCAGDGALIRHMSAAGHECICAIDIEPQAGGIIRADALEAEFQPWAADYIISNPPWNRRILHPIIERFSQIMPTWLLFDADWIHTRQSAPFQRLLSKVVSVGRVKWIPDSKMTGKDNVAWHLFDARHAGPTEFIGRSPC